MRHGGGMERGEEVLGGVQKMRHGVVRCSEVGRGEMWLGG